MICYLDVVLQCNASLVRSKNQFTLHFIHIAETNDIGWRMMTWEGPYPQAPGAKDALAAVFTCRLGFFLSKFLVESWTSEESRRSQETSPYISPSFIDFYWQSIDSGWSHVRDSLTRCLTLSTAALLSMLALHSGTKTGNQRHLPEMCCRMMSNAPLTCETWCDILRICHSQVTALKNICVLYTF